MVSGNTYWIIGASEGLGRAVAQELDKRGASLVLSARSGDRLEDLAAGMTQARVVPIDVTDVSSVATAVSEVGEIDGLVYLAGFYEPTAAPNWAPEKVELMFDTNLMGAVRVLGRVIPDFCRRNTGHIVLIGSISGYRGLPGAIGYGASKAGLMHLGENLYADLHKTDLKIQTISPGFIRTRLTDKNDFKMPQIMSPDDAATIVVDAMESSRFQTSFPRPFAWLFKYGRFLPNWAFYRIFG